MLHGELAFAVFVSEIVRKIVGGPISARARRSAFAPRCESRGHWTGIKATGAVNRLHGLFWSQRGDDFFEARIAAERVP